MKFLLAKMIRRIRRIMGLPVPLMSLDRKILEDLILPAYAEREEIRDVLFVGVRDYTAHYQMLLPNRNYYTLDKDESARRWGARQHFTDGVENLAKHFTENSLDLIILNGVFGWGLDRFDECESAFSACYSCLRPGGELMLGWNNVPEHLPVSLDSITALGHFEKVVFNNLGVHRFETETSNNHTFDFYRKPRR